MAKQVQYAASTAVLSLTQTIDLLCNMGEDVTTLVQGDMGSGKTQLLREIVRRTGKTGVYFDCTTKDLGDLFLPDIYRFDGVAQSVSFVPNEEFGIHLNEPVVLMLDELGKNRSILNGLLRVMQERSVGSRTLPKGSIVFATTNLGAENVGDMLPPHARNRIMIVRMKKPNKDEWTNWAAQNDIEPCLIAAVHEFPQMLESFLDVEKPEDNPYIYDPRDSSRTSFVTPRSLEKCSYVLHKRAVLGEEITTQAMIGLIGGAAALPIMALVTLDDALPKYPEICNNPMGVRLPDSPAARIMSAIGCMQRVQQEDFKNVFTYVKRLPMETQALFTYQLMKSSTKAPWVAKQSDFTEFTRKNFQIFSNN